MVPEAPCVQDVVGPCPGHRASWWSLVAVTGATFAPGASYALWVLVLAVEWGLDPVWE